MAYRKGWPLLHDRVPAGFVRMFGVRVDPGMLEMMFRRGRSMEEQYLLAFNALLWGIVLLLPLTVAILIFFPYPYRLFSVGLTSAMIAFPTWVASAPLRLYRQEQRSFLVDSPAVIGAMTMGMNRQPSLEKALELASRSGKGALHSSLSLVVWRGLTGEMEDLRKALCTWTTRLDHMNEGLRRSLSLIMAAEEEAGREGRDRLLDRANFLALEGLREACERYVGSLSFPVMVVFAFGVLAPVMLFSLLPLLGLGGNGSLPGGALDVSSLTFLLLVLVPSATVLYVRSTLSRNPLRSPDLCGKGRVMFPLLSLASSALLFLGAMALSGDIQISVLLGLSSMLALLILCGGRKGREEDDRPFIDGLYRLGNGMLGGQDLEMAFEEAVRTGEGGFQVWGRRLLHATRTGRQTLVQAARVDGELVHRNRGLHQSYLTVMECAQEDQRGAGRVAIDLAQCQDDLARTRRKVRENLRSVMDMMTCTSVLFAPAIIGLTGGIMGMLGGEDDWLLAISMVYVVELSALVNHFVSNLDRQGSGGWEMRTYGLRGAMALAVLLIASLCGRTFLFRLL
ncbi:MAG: hypothetical protein JXA45_02930 [Methanomassiliicoccales archaeon]|nr:hypothetical protein [Methanomassiliicoccales archaeon]